MYLMVLLERDVRDDGRTPVGFHVTHRK